MAMNDSGTVANIQAQLAALAKQYRDQLPAKLEEMLGLWNRLRAGWEPESAETLHRMAHSMAGSCGTMGLAHIGNAARSLERRLKQLVAEPSALQDMAQGIAEAVDALAASIGEGAEAKEVVKAETEVETVKEEKTLALSLPPLKILVADDETVSRSVLAALLKADGHAVREAGDGEQAVDLFEEEKPDLILMDVIMPRMNGYEAARKIKAQCGKHFVPLIFLTALTDEKDLVACIDAGGDDFMVKPYNRTLLRAKLIAMHRISKLHRELERYQQKTEEEIALSQHVFETATNRNENTPSVAHWQAAVGHFSGDLALYARTPQGRLFVLQGDFTGHGLAAALGALPVSDLFYNMVEDETSLPDLVVALNRKLKMALPMGHFCAACILVLAPDGASMEIWNGGLPGAWVVDGGNRVIERLTSDKIPLGILGDASFDTGTKHVSLPNGARVLLFSDGLSEATNGAGDMLGEDGVEQQLLAAKRSDLVAELREAVDRHLGGVKAHDDISITLLDPAGGLPPASS